MTILFDATRKVKSARPFAAGLTTRRRPFVPTPADMQWAAETSPTRNEFYDVVGPSDAWYDNAAGAALVTAKMSAGYPIL
jgi:hypothetical protein